MMNNQSIKTEEAREMDADEITARIMKEIEDDKQKVEKVYAYNRKLGPGLQIHKVFSTRAGDGFAYYEIIKITKINVWIKWRNDLGIDVWQDSVLGQGGRFPRTSIEQIVLREEALAELFKGKRK